MYIRPLALFVAVITLSCCEATFGAVDAAAAKDRTDPQRFFQVKQWDGLMETGTQGSGTRKEGDSTVTWKSSIRVDARFKIQPHRDKRNLDPISWTGKGEAHIR